MTRNVETEEDVSLQFKVIILGDGAVGKTSMITRFIDDSFSPAYKQTLGLDFHSHKIMLPESHAVMLQIWDIGGQSIGSKMLPHYVSGSHAILLVYDITNKESFLNIEEWHRIIVQTFRGQKPAVVGLVANKCDMIHSSEVSVESHHLFADENRLHSYRISAKSGDQVTACFANIAGLLTGVKICRHEAQRVRTVAAEVLSHPQHDTKFANSQVLRKATPKKTMNTCTLS